MGYKYESLLKKIKADIETGRFAPGERIPSEPRISKETGLSRNTIRQALRELELKGYLYRVQGKGTFVASRPAKKSNKIALVLYDLHYAAHPFTGEMIKGIGETLAKEDYALEILATGDFDSLNDELTDNSRHAGFIVAAQQIEREHIAKMILNGIPFVMAKNYVPGLKINSTVFDYEKAGSLAARHLLSLNHSKIALLNAGNTTISTEFTNGVKRAFKESGKELNEKDIFDIAFEPDNVLKYIGDLAVYSGIITFDDNIAFQVITELKDLGVNVPEDISVVGCNDVRAASGFSPALTTIKLPIGELGRISASKLLSIIKGDPQEENVVLEPELVIRNSTTTSGAGG